MLRKKGATPFAIFLLVIMTIILTTATLVVLLNVEKKIKLEIIDAKFIENIYVKEEQVKFFLVQIGETAFEKTNPWNEKNFKKNLKAEISKNKGNDAILSQLPTKEPKVVYDSKNKKLYLEFKDIEFIATRKIEKTKYAKLFWIIPSPFSYKEITEQIGVVYKTDLKVEIKLK